MLMRAVFLAFCLAVLPGFCYAQASQPQITVGLDAMSSAQDQNQARAQAQAAAAAQRQAREVADERTRQRAADRRAEEAERAADAAAAVQQNRDSNFQETERQLLIEQQQIELQKERTDADRENDMINHDLTQQDAQTAVIQSRATATTVTANANAAATVDQAEGAQSLLTDTGRAEVKKASGIFGN